MNSTMDEPQAQPGLVALAGFVPCFVTLLNRGGRDSTASRKFGKTPEQQQSSAPTLSLHPREEQQLQAEIGTESWRFPYEILKFLLAGVEGRADVAPE